MCAAMAATSLRRRPFIPTARVYRWVNAAPMRSRRTGWSRSRASDANDLRARARDHARAARGSPGAYGRAALEREIAELASTPHGLTQSRAQPRELLAASARRRR